MTQTNTISLATGKISTGITARISRVILPADGKAPAWPPSQAALFWPWAFASAGPPSLAFWPSELDLVKQRPSPGAALAVLDLGAKDRVQHLSDRHRKQVNQVPEARLGAEPGILFAHLVDDLPLVKRAYRVVERIQRLVPCHGRDQGLQVVVKPDAALALVFPNVGLFIGSHLTLRVQTPGLTCGLPDRVPAHR